MFGNKRNYYTDNWQSPSIAVWMILFTGYLIRAGFYGFGGALEREKAAFNFMYMVFLLNQITALAEALSRVIGCRCRFPLEIMYIYTQNLSSLL